MEIKAIFLTFCFFFLSKCLLALVLRWGRKSDNKKAETSELKKKHFAAHSQINQLSSAINF